MPAHLTTAPPVNTTASSGSSRFTRMLMVFSLLWVVAAIAITRSWPLIHDAPLMHYVVFLMDHGRAPYRDIIEMNMPGSYILEWLAIHTLGAGATGWWLWDSASGLAAILAGTWIAGPGRRSAGITGGALAYLAHLSTGPANWGQRDWIVAVLFLLGVGALFTQIRKAKPVWMAAFTFLTMLAATIKPPALLIAVCFVVASCLMARRSGKPVFPLIAWAAAGTILPLLLCVAFLLHFNVVPDFLVILRGLVPWYAGLQRLSYSSLLRHSLPRLFLPLALGTLVLYITSRSWRSWQQNFLLSGVLAGLLLFLSQRKGWTYHLGLELGFLSMWLVLEIDRALDLGSRQRTLAIFGAAFTVLVALPLQLRAVARSTYPLETIHHLEADLDRLGGPALNNNIQCLDMTLGGCINVLYRQHLVQTTGFIYDYYLFPQQPNQVTPPIQRKFLTALTARPPKVIVLSAQIWPGDRVGYDEVATWPAFSQWLTEHYTLESQYPGSGKDGYRIYTRTASGQG